MVTACHDISDGGLLVAAAEMALAGRFGVRLEVPEDAGPAHAWLFGEDQGRYLITAEPASVEAILERAGAAGVTAAVIAIVGGIEIDLGSGGRIGLRTLEDAHEGWLPAYMAGP